MVGGRDSLVFRNGMNGKGNGKEIILSGEVRNGVWSVMEAGYNGKRWTWRGGWVCEEWNGRKWSWKREDRVDEMG